MNDDANPQPGDSAETLLAMASLGLIADHLGQAIYALDREGCLVLVNRPCCTLVGKTREELLGSAESVLFSETAGQKVEGRELSASEQPSAAEHHFVGGGGEKRSITRVPLTDSSGTVTHVVSVVGERGEAAASAEQLQEEMERFAHDRTRALMAVQEERLRKERLMVLGQLSAGLAHQLRNPLGAISNAIALARRQSETQEGLTAEALRIANDEIWEANRIITDLLDYARIRPSATSPSSLPRLVEGAIQMEPPPEAIQIRLSIPEVDVHVDEKQVRDAVRNLVRNAVDAMNGEGRLEFTASIEEAWATLRIRDNGVGVPSENRQLLFEPLVTSKPLGIGLGLPTARALVTHQRGTLECVPVEGDGACFEMRLPRKAEEPPC